MARVLLFGGGLQSLSLARGLKDTNNDVINVADGYAVGRHSKFIDIFREIDIRTLTVDSLIDFIISMSIDIIIPMEDEYALWLSKYSGSLKEYTQAQLAVENFELLSMVCNKQTLLSFCEKNNIPHPKTYPLNLNFIETISKELGYPLLIKPNISNGSRGICIISSQEELRIKAVSIQSQYGGCTVQEYIEQQHYYNVMLYRYADGELGPSVVTKISRFYPVKGGSSSFCTTVENSEIIKPCVQLLTKLNWVGFADFDVLEKGVGDFKIIEINPRVPASIHAAYISGVNYGEVIVSDLLKHEKITYKYSPGKNLRFLGLDIAWLISSPKRFKYLGSWLNFFNSNTWYQEGGASDYRAMIYSLLTGVKKLLSPTFRRAKSGMN